MGLPVGWEPYESDRFRTKTQDDKTCLSITNWILDDRLSPTQRQTNVLALYDKFVQGGGYEPYADLIIQDSYISQSFRVDSETQYYLTRFSTVGDKTYQSGFIIRDIGAYDPQMRATLLQLVHTMKFT